MSYFKFLDIILNFLHIAIIAVNISFWVFKKTRIIHIICALLTLFSWVGLGFSYGWGYCFLTDWHWRIKGYLGETQLPYSYIKYLVDRLIGIDSDPLLIDTGTGIIFGAVFILSCFLNIKDYLYRRKSIGD